MPENQRLCCHCRQYKPWVWSGKKLKDGSKVYVDKENVRWAGRRCPDCEKSRVRAALKCTFFERDLIFNELRKQGFEILSFTFPLKVSRNEQNFTVGVRHAITKDGEIVLENDGLQNSTDLYILLFSSPRMITKEQIECIQDKTRGEKMPAELNHSMMSLMQSRKF